MNLQELQDARAELATLKASRLQRLTRGTVRSAGNGGENVSRELATYDQLDLRIRELEREIRMAEGRWFGALHLR